MSFFFDRKDFTHDARFYLIPCYAKITDDDFVLSGTNRVTDALLLVATAFHNNIVEFFAQLWAAILGADYEPGFPIYVKEFDK